MPQSPSASASSLDARIERLERDLAHGLSRIAALEAQVVGGPSGQPSPIDDTATEPAEPQPVPSEAVPDVTALAGLLGRTFIVFGGAFLLRALTEGGVVPGAVGVLLGLVYALGWLVAADRSAERNRLSARFHGAASVLIAWPLVAEATTRFQLVDAPAATLLLALLVTGVYVVATRRDLPWVAGLAGFATIGVGTVIAAATGSGAVVSLLLITLATATYWLTDARTRAWLRWPVAIAAGLSVLAVTVRALATPPREPAWLTLVALGWLVANMQGSLAVRFVLLGREARVFDAMQALSGFVIGVGGAVLLTRAVGAGTSMVAATVLLMGLGAYLAAIVRLADRPTLSGAFHTSITFGLSSVVVALALLLGGAGLALVAIVPALLMVLRPPAHLARTFVQHGLVFALVAMAASGALAHGWSAWIGAPASWPALSLTAAVTIVAVGICAVWAGPTGNGVAYTVTRVLQHMVAATVVFAAGGVLVLVAAPGLAGTPPDLGILASVRTGIVALVAVGAAFIARLPRQTGFSRLVYPILIAGGLRLVIDDFRHSEPATLFLALALYGAALVVAPRLAAKTHHA
jgi:hypothetical protein